MSKRKKEYCFQQLKNHNATKLSLEFQGVTIALSSDHEIPVANLREMEDYVTGMQIYSYNDRLSQDGKLEYFSSDNIEIEYRQEESTMILRGPVHLFGGGSTLAYIAQYMAECIRASKSGLLLVHAAAVKSPSRNLSYVILGEKGAGKTTLAIRLCHQYGYRIIGNDQIFLGPSQEGTLVTRGGNTWFNIRETAMLADPYLSGLLAHLSDTSQPAWNNKIKIDSQTIGVAADTAESPVGSIFHIRIDRTQPELHVAKWVSTQRNLVLHERFGRHISGQATPFQDDKGNYLGSLPLIDPARTFRARDELVRLVNKVGIIEIFAPDSKSATDFIINQVSP